MCENLRAQVKHTDVPVPLLITFCMYCCKHLRSIEYDASGAPLRIAIAIPSLYTETSKTDECNKMKFSTFCTPTLKAASLLGGTRACV